MDTKKKVLIGAGSAAVLAGGFVAFRLYVRSETRKALAAEYAMDEHFKKLEAIQVATGIDYNLPSYDEFVDALVPVWSFTLPKEAVEDILQHGRESAFWSDAHKEPVNRAVESIIFRALRAAYETPEGASTKDIAVAAGLSVLQDLITSKKQ